MLCINDLSFQYTTSKKNNLNHISLDIQDGEIVLITGQSGSGKTTLLKHFKKELLPPGQRVGHIYYNGKDILEIPSKVSSQEIGYVFQNPDHQIALDYVYHEIAFGLENIGIPHEQMYSRVGEIVQYFHLENIYDKRTNKLSGGEKQLVNLASVMIMQPQVLLLDEPLSQLDPKSREQFISMLMKLHHDFHITIIMVTHQLDEIFDYIDRMIVLENGNIVYNDSLQQCISYLKDTEMMKIFPPYIQLLSLLNQPTDYTFYQTREIVNILKSKTRTYEDHKEIIQVKHLNASYDKDVLSDVSLMIKEKEIFCILGNNGSGKSTFLKCLLNEMKYKGKISINGKVGYLPQDPMLLMNRDTVKEELAVFCKEDVDKLIHQFHFEDVFNSHPYDLSGGQQQILALMKLILNDCDILLLDEPTKGIDPLLKKQLGEILEQLVQKGKTIICVSHDLEFCGEYGTYLTLLFHHRFSSIKRPIEFFRNNYFYTTQLSKLTRDNEFVISLKDVVF